MKALIGHLLKCNREEILRRSLLHCHTHNVHSIMLLDAPGKTIRLFVAEPGHGLYHNNPPLNENQTIAFHAHHCELTLVATRGMVKNWIMQRGSSICRPINEYRYTSPIAGGVGSFTHVGEAHLQTKDCYSMSFMQRYYMPATDIHTVFVPKDEWAAWLVFEGRENHEHDNHCWSRADLTKWDASELYKPMRETQLDYLIAQSDVLL